MSLTPAESPTVDEILKSIRRMMSEETVTPFSRAPLKPVPDILGLKGLLPRPYAGRTQGVVDSAAMEVLISRLLRPLLKSWLDENLPTLVEKVLQQEIKNAQKTS